MTETAHEQTGAVAPRGPLHGLRVLDLSRILAGPSCTQLLGDLGADIIKVERPGTGDDTRSWGPPFVADEDGQASDVSAYFLSANRNKRSIAIDFTKPAGAELIRAFAAVCDIVVENYKPGDLDRHGVGYVDMRFNPKLIWCSITGFGRTGPYADRIGYDFLIQAMGGIMSLTGEPDGEPVKVGVGIADVVCGLYCTTAILAALRHRDQTGQGQLIDVSLYDTQVAWLINGATNYLVSGKPPRRLGNRHPNIAPYQTYPARDGHLVVAVGNDAQFRRFAQCLAREDMVADPRFTSNAARVQHVDELEAEVAPILKTRNVTDWVAAFSLAKVPAGPVSTIPDVLSNPHTIARGMVVEIPSPVADGKSVRLLGNPLNFSATPVAYRLAPPSLNADQATVLRDVLKLSADEIAALQDKGAFGDAQQPVT
jgi:crotonobetainyl-CoA:carnitine CoA-transferase CaiB-like acyl-CoA transferase